MEAITSSQHERAEVQAVFQSGLFDKAPRLGKFFLYICDRYFEGNADQIKEYSIAVEALGRSENFDSKRDSIVRVEAHRLRKRLDEYYKGSGADHPVHILIPNGQYRPHFVSRDHDALAAASPASLLSRAPESSAAELTAIIEPAPRSSRSWIILTAFVVVALGAGVWAFLWRSPKPTAKPAEVWSGAVTDPVPAEFRMLTGYHGPPFVDRQGHKWSPDAYYTGGFSIPIAPDRFLEGLPDPRLIKAERSGTFHYDIPVAGGTHEVRLYFAETDYGRGNPQGGAEGSRTFDLTVNGQIEAHLLDPLAQAGAPEPPL